PPGPYGAPLWQPAPGGAGAGAAGRAPHVWTRFEYLMWFSRDEPNRYPLLTTSAPNDRGLLGRSSTLVLAGGGDLSFGTLSGFRITSGFFGDADRRYGFEASGFLLPEQSYRVEAATSPSGIPLLARPFVDSTNPRGTNSLVVASPTFAAGPLGTGLLSGPVAARAVVDASSSLWGLEANGVLNLFRSEPGCKTLWSIDAFAGYRFVELDEELFVQSTSQINIPDIQVPIFVTGPFGIRTQVGTQSVPVPVSVGGVNVFNPGRFQVTDRFTVANRFNGGNFGLRTEVRHGMWSVMATGKIAVGNMEYRADIDGKTEFVDLSRGAAGGTYGGLLANAGNIGRYKDNEFVVIPEGTINVGIALTRSLTGFVGYNYLWISDVVRPGTLAGPVVNTATVPLSPNYGAAGRPAAPRIVLARDDYWVQGVNLGFLLRY
ncbi:MAG: BBP7 family outer membrane beta-barrel protein, partial [Gemmataceae bacterium]|nr:BBP7 family outer membrane beta-barrel protein [Gemmataceae bacterium]